MASGQEIADCVLVDWGTSSLRLWVVGRDGEVLARRSSADGMATLEPGAYEDVLLGLVADFLPAGRSTPTPVIVCGMAGARNGWREAPYRPVPCEPAAPGDLTPVATRDRRIAVAIVPGICQSAPPDVMRGEETQLAGLVSQVAVTDAVVCLPGTHSKWVFLEGGRVKSFTTFMTGELYAVIAAHSILRHSVGGEADDEAAFRLAVARMIETPRELTAALFSIRAASLVEGLGAEAARSRLSGLLIGAELAATRRDWERRPVHLIGADRLADRYAIALQSVGGSVVRHDAEELTLAGLANVRRLMRAKVPVASIAGSSGEKT